MTLGLARNTAQSLLNRIPLRKESKPIDGYGCLHCGLVYSVGVYAVGRGGQLGELSHCPFCGVNQVKYLGNLPGVAEDGGKYFLLDDEGYGTGPFDSEHEARLRILDWFKGKEHHAKEKERGRLILLHSLPRAEEASGRRAEEGSQNKERGPTKCS